MPILFRRFVIGLVVTVIIAFVLLCGRSFYYSMRFNSDIGSAGAHMDKNEYDQAIASLQDALRLDPHTPEIHVDLSRCYFKKGDLIMARREMDNAISMNPQIADRDHDYLVILNQRSNNRCNRRPTSVF